MVVEIVIRGKEAQQLKEAMQGVAFRALMQKAALEREDHPLALQAHELASNAAQAAAIIRGVEDEPAMEKEPRAKNPGNLRILIVEDHEDTAEMLRTYLEVELPDSEVKVFRNAQETLAGLGDFQPNMAILDISLGENRPDGYQLLRSLRDSRDLKQTAFIALTGHASDRARALKEGFHTFLAKPADPLQIMRSIVKALLRQRASEAT